MNKATHIQTQFIDFIKKNELLNEGEMVLLAVSGGIDSMIMVDLFLHAGYSFAIAHCNFQLRGQDADNDEEFVKAFAEGHRLDFFSKKFDTAAYARQHKLSIQMAARELRYQYLENIRKTEAYKAIATAHHLDDAIETLLINIIRGTGIGGLKGIPAKNNKVIRPLLFATKDELRDYAIVKKLAFRDDKSNTDEKYLRNKIRHRIIPVLKEINPSFDESMMAFFEKMQAANDLYQQTITHHKKMLLRYYQDETHLLLKPLSVLANAETILFEMLREYGFSPAQCRDIFLALYAQPGKRFYSGSHSLLKDRECLIISRIHNESEETPVHQIHQETKMLSYGDTVFCFETGSLDDTTDLPKNARTLLADSEKLDFPLSLRPWKDGDKIQPIGMVGHKKISDLLIDKKISLNKKKEILVLTSGDQVIWLPGLRASEKFKITNKTKKYFKAVML